MSRGIWTYSGDPSTSQQDELRFLYQDTDPELKLLNDAELRYLLNKWLPIYGSIIYVASIAADVVSAQFAGMTTIEADGVSVDVSKVSDTYAALAGRLRKQFRESTEAGDLSDDLAELMSGTTLDPGIAPLKFAMDLHDNLYAGQQDYGGTQPPYDNWWNESGPP